MSNVLLVDDHPVVRQGIARILAAEIPELRIADADDGASALAQLRTGPCDLILLDLTLPGDSGLVVLRKERLVLERALGKLQARAEEMLGKPGFGFDRDY